MTAVCVRRGFSRWPNCACPDCTIIRRRVDKARKCGLLIPPRTGQAWARIDELHHLGWTQAAIATAAGISRKTMDSATQLRRINGHYTWSASHAERILTVTPTSTPTSGYIGAHGARRRLRALAAIGWGCNAISTTMGGPHSTSLASVRSGSTTAITPTLDAAVRAAYVRLSGTPAPASPKTTFTTRHAVSHGWGPPGAYDDTALDNPDPAIDAAATASMRVAAVDPAAARVVRLAEIVDLHHLTPTGLTHADAPVIAARFHVSTRQIERDLRDLRDRGEVA